MTDWRINRADSNNDKAKIVAFIAHPIGGNVEFNLRLITGIIRNIHINEPDVIPFAPYYADLYALDDADAKERAKGIANSLHFIDGRYIDELRLYGNRISYGMGREVVKALTQEIYINAMTPQTEDELEKYEYNHRNGIITV